MELCQTASKNGQDADRYNKIMMLLKKANDQSQGLSLKHLQMHEQSPRGVWSPVLPAKFTQSNHSDSQSVTSCEMSAASTKSATSSRLFIPKKDCMFWVKGDCRNGGKCTFKHDPQKKGTGRGTDLDNITAGSARFQQAASMSTRPAASSKSKAPAPRANFAVASKNSFSSLKEEGANDE